MIIPVDATIAVEKVRDYLLKPLEKDDKSRYLLQAGYSRENYWELIRDIQQLLPANAVLQERRRYGAYYAMRSKLRGPNGTNLVVKIIWILDLDDKIRFVTLLPNKESTNDEI